MKKTWREKLADDKGLPHICEATEKQARRWGAGRFVIPAPREVDALMKQVPKRRVATINEWRAALAKRHGVDFACPVTTGIFAWIAAHAAAEAEAAGVRRITPYWRMLKAGGEINPRYPGGAQTVARRLRAEGHRIMRRGRRLRVADVEKRVFTKFK